MHPCATGGTRAPVACRPAADCRLGECTDHEAGAWHWVGELRAVRDAGAVVARPGIQNEAAADHCPKNACTSAIEGLMLPLVPLTLPSFAMT